MPKRREKGLCSELTRHGKRVWYFREGQGTRIRIRGEFGSPEFNAAIAAAKGYGSNPVQAKAVLSHQDQNSLAWLIDQYMSSSAWNETAAQTQKQRRNILKRIAEKSGSQPFRSLTRTDVEAIREKIAATGATAQANAVIKVLRVFFAWATPNFMSSNIARDVKLVERDDSEGLHTWTEEELAQFERTYPLGTREYLAYAVLLWTGQRRGDCVQLGDQHVRDGVIRLKHRKTGCKVAIPVMPELTEALAAGPRGDLVWIVGDKGLPLTADTFTGWFRKVCNAAGLKECSAHGLRKAAARRLAERGATVDELKAWFGWTENQTPGIYTREADKERLAANAAKRLRVA
jgi:integrase